jgi:hypothetical protein
MTGPIHFEPEPGARPGAPGMQVPRPALIMAGMLIVFVIGLAASAKWFGFGADREVATTVLMQRELQFADAADGGIVVTDAVTKQQAAVIDPGTNGFFARRTARAHTHACLERHRPGHPLQADPLHGWAARVAGPGDVTTRHDHQLRAHAGRVLRSTVAVANLRFAQSRLRPCSLNRAVFCAFGRGRLEHDPK